MATLCDIVSRLPSAIVVIACLENYYEELRKLLTKPVDGSRRERSAAGRLAIALRPERSRKPDRPSIEVPLRSLGASYRADEPTFPLPEASVRELAGMRARDVLSRVQSYRERSIEKGKMAEFPFEQAAATVQAMAPKST